MKTPNPNLYILPEFTDSDGMVHRARDWQELILKVTAYRSRNGFPPGNPEQEIFSQICGNYPKRCVDNSPIRVVNYGHLLVRLITWLARLLITRPSFVSEEEATRRADICRSCPKQVKWRQQGCETCKSVDKFAAQVLNGRPANDLLACEALYEDCRVNVWMEQPGLEGDVVPSHCWRKKSVL